MRKKMPPGFVKALQEEADSDEVDETPGPHHGLGEQTHWIIAGAVAGDINRLPGGQTAGGIGAGGRAQR